MKFIHMMLYAGSYNVLLGIIYFFSKVSPTTEGIFFGGLGNICIALICLGVLKFAKGGKSE